MTPISIDITTGDVITPDAVEYCIGGIIDDKTEQSEKMFNVWQKYRNSFGYAQDIRFEDTIEALKNLLDGCIFLLEKNYQIL